MPDTGAPWNIPYVENADLVSDWPADSLLVANAVAAGLSAAGPAGIGSNVVQAVKTDTFATNSATFTAVTGMSVAITPTSATSKILVIAQIVVGGQNNNAVGSWKVTRGGTDIYIGDAASNRIRAIVGGFVSVNVGESVFSHSIVYLDSPSTTSSTTYQLEARRGASSINVYLNRSAADSDFSDVTRGASSITAIEVAA